MPIHVRRAVTVAIVVLAAILAGFRPALDAALTPNGARNPLVFNAPQDYYSYLSFIQQGREGSWRMTSRFTPEVNRPEFYVPVYAALGHLGRLTGLPNEILFTAARFVAGAVFLVVVSLLNRVVVGTGWAWVAAMVSVVVGPPLWVWAGGRFVMRGMEFTGFDPFIRGAFLPHHMAANICMVAAVLVLSRTLCVQNVALATVFIVVGGLENPAVMLMAVPAIAIGILGGGLRRRTVVVTAVLVGAAALVTAWYAHVLNADFPWNYIYRWESRQVFPIGPGSLYLILGGIGLFAPLGIPAAWKRGIAGRFVVWWYLGPFVGLLLSAYIPLATMRFLQGAPYVPAAILGVLGVGVAFRFVVARGVPRQIVTAVLSFAIATAIIPSLVAGIERQLVDARTAAANQMIAVPFPIWEVMGYLRTHGEVGDVVLAGGWEGAVVGAFTGKTSVFGHTIATYRPEEKLRDALEFYSARDVSAMAGILARYRVRYVLTYRPGFTDAVVRGLGLREVFSNATVILYATR